MRSLFRPAAAIAALALLLDISARCEDFTYTTNNGTITITGYRGPGGEVPIPSEISGLPVTCIGELAFSGTAVTNVIIPNSVTRIGDGAFAYCRAMG